MVKKTNRTTSPMNTGAFKRVFGVLVVLLLASALLVGAGSANTEEVTAEATAPVTGLNYTQFLAALVEANYNYDGQDITVTFDTDDLNGFFKHGDTTYQTSISNAVDITIKNVTFSSATFPHNNMKGVEMVFSNAGALTLENCVFTNKVGVSTQDASTDITVNYCTFNGNTGRYSLHCIHSPNVTVTNSIFTNIRGGIYLEKAKNIVTVTNNTFTTLIEDKGAVQFSAAEGAYSTATITLEQNTVDNSGAFIRQLNAGLASVLNEDTIKDENTLGGNVYTSDSVIPVAAIGDKKYTTLVAAFEAVTGSEETTITLLRDAEGAGIFVGADDNKNIILDLNNHKYTCVGPAVGSAGTESQAFHLEKGNTITIKNGEIASTSAVGMLIQNYCDLTLDTVKVNGTNVDGTYTISNNCGKSVYKGTTEIIAPTNGVAFDVWYNLDGNYPDGVSVTIADTDVKITGAVEYGCDTLSNGDKDFPEAAVLLIPEGYTLAVPTVSTSTSIIDQTPANFCWGVDEAHPGMLKLVPCDPIEPKVEATMTPDQDGNTTLSGSDVTTALNGKTNGAVVPELVLETTGAKVVITYNSTGGTVDASAQTVEGNITSIVAAYDEVAAPSSDDVNITVTFALNVTLNTSALGTNFVLPVIDQTFNDEVKEIAKGENKNFQAFAQINGTAPAGVTMEQLNGNITEIKLTFTVPADFVTKYGQGKFLVLHVKDGIVIETLTPVWAANGQSFTVTGTKGFSDYIAVVDTYVAPKDTGSGSSSSGSSVWLQEPVTPTETPTEQPTDKPTDTVPTDIPSTQPTATPSTPGFGILAVLAGLGAVAALRRQ